MCGPTSLSKRACNGIFHGKPGLRFARNASAVKKRIVQIGWAPMPGGMIRRISISGTCRDVMIFISNRALFPEGPIYFSTIWKSVSMNGTAEGRDAGIACTDCPLLADRKALLAAIDGGIHFVAHGQDEDLAVPDRDRFTVRQGYAVGGSVRERAPGRRAREPRPRWSGPR